MGITEKVNLPSEEELTVQEVNISGPALKAGAFHLGKYCENENNEFMLCKKELKDPRKCIKEGKNVTTCALNFFRQMKQCCASEFIQYANCLDKSSPDQQFKPCRKTQAVLDQCVKESIGIERPAYDYYTRVHIHDSKRPKPEEEKNAIYPDPTPGLPEDAPRAPAKYGARYIFMW